MIPASPTSYDTVYTILKRSVAIADQLNIPTITIVFDMAIYIKAQDIRWADNELLNRTAVRLGEFHTCMTFLSVIGKRFSNAGLMELLVESDVVATGSVNAVLEGRHYNRAISAHKIVVEAMEHLRFEAYYNSVSEERQKELSDLAKSMISVFPSTSYCDLLQEGGVQSFLSHYNLFCARQASASPTFALWQSYIDMVSTLLHFISCTRRSDWEGHLNTLEKMTPWLFAYDRVNYSRYVPVYLHEMRELEKTYSFAHEHLHAGEFAIQQQVRYRFSATAADQVIEQTVNRDSKSAGGIVGITTRPNAVAKWILSQSQRLAMTQLCRKYANQGAADRYRKDLDSSRRALDATRVDSVIDVIEVVVNPFDYEGCELVNIYSGIVASPPCQEDFLNAYKSGKKAQQDFTTRFVSDPKELHRPMKKMNLQTFKTTAKPKKDKKGKELSNRKLFARLIILVKEDRVKLREVLTYSLGPVSYPLASSDGFLAKTPKSAIVDLVQGNWPVEEAVGVLPSSAVVIDAMCLVHSFLPSRLPKNFKKFAACISNLITKMGLHFNASRVDLVFDTYPVISIKALEHARRHNLPQATSSLRRIISSDQQLPKQWKEFLRHGPNKEELSIYL